jgi:hypothetical protein
VSQFRAAGEILDTVNTGMTPDEIKVCLERVKNQILLVERRLKDAGGNNNV